MKKGDAFRKGLRMIEATMKRGNGKRRKIESERTRRYFEKGWMKSEQGQDKRWKFERDEKREKEEKEGEEEEETKKDLKQDLLGEKDPNPLKQNIFCLCKKNKKKNNKTSKREGLCDEPSQTQTKTKNNIKNNRKSGSCEKASFSLL